MELANKLIGNAPKAMSEVKSLIQYIKGHTNQENVSRASQVFEKTVSGPEAVYGVGCFIQKKKPDWDVEFKNQSKL